ncbi:MAG: chromosomal replication initiator protein DnaA [Verrucomicrobiaceae bacterium]|nr:MAG: chromosomal replication initiator protein DnaA [Verrucomicrobiaceae bacterium]
MSDRSSLAALWSHVVDNLRARISPDAYERWFSSICLTEITEESARLAVPDAIHKLWIEMNYLPPLRESFKSITGIIPLLELECATHNLQQQGPPPMAPRSRAVKVQAAAPEAPSPVVRAAAVRLPAPPAPKEPEPVPDSAVEEPVSGNEDGIAQRHTFNTFVVGANNQFAHAAAMAVAQRPARAYNPLFLHGGTGLGKTHLMHAIGAHIRGARPKARVLYITSEEFTNQFIGALQEHSLPKFRKRFRLADVLLIDDIQFLAGKERSQEEFFHTFNALFDGNKQLVLSSDCPPAEMRNLESRLASRFEWGMMAEVTPPDEETRVAILRKRAESLRVEVPPNVIDYLASRIRSNVRRLHGALFRVASWISLHGPISLVQTEDLMRDLVQEESTKHITIDRIQKTIAESFDIRIADMTSRKRPANIAFARQVAMYLSRELTGCSYQEIGLAFGGRDHGTIMHACRSVDSRLKEQESLRLRLDSLMTTLKRSS